MWSREGSLQPFPGTLRQNAVQAFACGATLVTYFQWRTFRFGAEQLESSIIDTDGVPRRRYREFQQAAKDVKSLEPLLNETTIENQVATCFDYDSYWSTRIKPFKQGYDMREHLHAFATAMGLHGINCDVVPLNEAILSYKAVFLPSPMVLSEPAKATLRQFVETGGTLIASFLTGIRNVDHNAQRGEVPMGLTDLFGMRVGEGEPVFGEPERDSRALVRVEMDGQTSESRNCWWTEVLEPNDAQVIARYADGFRAGQPVMTRRRHGRGQAIYLGTWLEGGVQDELLAALVRSAGVEPLPVTGEKGVEVVRRVHGDGSPVYFVFNYRQAEANAHASLTLRDRMTGETFKGGWTMKAKGFHVLEPQ